MAATIQGAALSALNLATVGTIQIAPMRRIGPFAAQVTLEEKHVDELTITDHPVESGAVITDHAYMMPSEVVIKCGWSDSPKATDAPGIGTFANFAQSIGGRMIQQAMQIGSAVASVLGNLSAEGSAAGTPAQMYQNMLELQRSRTPFQIFTGKRIYNNMLVKSLQVTTDHDSENILLCTVTCREIMIVNTQVVSVGAPPENQDDPESTQATADKGTKSLTPASSYSSTSGETSMATSTNRLGGRR